MSDPVALRAWRDRAKGARRERRPRPAKGIVGVGAVAVVCVLGARAHTSTPRPSAAPLTTGPPPCQAVATALHADVDGDGCDEEVSFSGGVLTAGHLSMAVGGPDDRIALGRWTCGAVTVALLRPATGEVFRFDGWATEGNPVPAVALGRVEGAVDVRAAPRVGGHCDDVVVNRATGPPVLLPSRPVAG